MKPDWQPYYRAPEYYRIQLVELEEKISKLGYDVGYAYSKSVVDIKNGQRKYTSAYVKLDDVKYLVTVAARSFKDNHCSIIGRLRAIEKMDKAIKYYMHTGKVTAPNGPLFFIFYVQDGTNTAVESNTARLNRLVLDLTLWNPCETEDEWHELVQDYRVDLQEALLNTCISIRKSIAGISRKKEKEITG